MHITEFNNSIWAIWIGIWGLQREQIKTLKNNDFILDKKLSLNLIERNGAPDHSWVLLNSQISPQMSPPLVLFILYYSTLFCLSQPLLKYFF